MRPMKLSDEALQAALGTLNTGLSEPWRITEGKLAKEFRFADFRTAFAFMTRVAEDANRLDHHPEWFNVYNTVRVALVTHDAKGITSLDFELARCIETTVPLT